MSFGTASGSPSPLASQWTDEKSASIDWSDPEDVLTNNFTFLQIVLLNPKLEDHMRKHPEDKESAKAVFTAAAATIGLLGVPLNAEAREAQVALVKSWGTKKLLTLQQARWCRRCGNEGHTRRTCPELADTAAAAAAVVATTLSGTGQTVVRPPSSRIMEKLFAHQQRIERLKLLEEKKRSTEGGASGGRGGQRRGRDGQPFSYQPSPASGEAEIFSDERRRGTIARIDLQFNVGFIQAPEIGEIRFFLNNADYGVKTMAVGDIIIFKLDTSRNYPLAIDVRLERPVVTLDDAVKFVDHCDRAPQPIQVITMLLSHPHEWHEVLRLICTRSPTLCQAAASATADPDAVAVAVPAPAAPQSFRLADAIRALVEMATFVGNREPIHLPMLQKFLAMMTTRRNELRAVSANPSLQQQQQADIAFYPEMLHAALREDLADVARLAPAEAEDRRVHLADHWIEMADYVVLQRQYAQVPLEAAQATREIMLPFFEERIASCAAAARSGGSSADSVVAAQRRLEAVVWRLNFAAGAAHKSVTAVEVVPAAAELAVPPPQPDSVFTPARLPINGSDQYKSTESFISAHQQLLRADTFEATSRIMPAACYNLPGYKPTAETLADVEHARVFWRVRFVARVMTRDRDFSQPASYILQLEPKSAKASMTAQLHQGTTVFISTSPDKKKMTDDEVFWGLVSSCDSHLLKAGMIVIAPCEGSAPFSKLEEKLRRNELGGEMELSMLMETPVFMSGYASIMRALGAFVGPMAMPLPMADLIVGPSLETDSTAQSAAEASAEGGELLPYIPPHCEHAFRELTKDIRSRFRLDAGQDAVMRRLPTSKILLVQGPPGTGKSFIGCRVVETYVRYKQLVASGDILQKINVDLIPDDAGAAAGLDRLLPHVGPVVVITYKNHALDEFLVDLLDSGLWEGARPRVVQQLAGGGGAAAASGGPASAMSPQEMFPRGRRLIRIGGRSKEGRLAGHNLGAMMHTITATSTIKSLKERVYVLNRSLETIAQQIQRLESGWVPRGYFESWLTTEHRQTMSFLQREEWLSGANYTGLSQRTAASPQLFMTILRTNIAAALEERTAKERGESAAGLASGAQATARAAAQAEEEREDVSLSVFQEMKREDERREYNDALHKTYVSAEAIHLAAHPPQRPAAAPESLRSLWSLDPVDRHEYYAYLIRESIAKKSRKCLILMDTIASVVQIRNHAVDEARLALLRGADVIGLTTTGCAMNQNLLRSLRPSVLVVEEAAEVLESQLLACMTDSLEQIVLIGDHYQLQPKVDTFMYEKVNHLNLSMFERLARRLAPIRLTDQRRMHPKISQLVRPFYDDQPLIDHPSVLARPFVTSSGQAFPDGVPGLSERVFFWRHDYPEEEAPGSRSKVNMRETLMAKQIALHLVAEGVSQSSITVITPYLGQCRMLRSVFRMSSLADVRVSTVDLFQGDENDIIILSITRTEKLTEFIRMRNRLIVSCSRARFAMVIVGNDALLRQCSHWAAVLEHLDRDGCVGDKLPITHRSKPDEVAFLEVSGTISAAKMAKELESASLDAPQKRPRDGTGTEGNEESGEVTAPANPAGMEDEEADNDE